MSRRGQAPAALAGLLALSVLLGALASLARRNAAPVDQDKAGPYIESFEGAVQRHAKESKVHTASGGGGSEAGLGGSAGGSPGGGGGAGASGAGASTPLARGVPGRPELAPNAPRLSAAVSTELGRELAQLLQNADVSVLAIGHKGGSFAYSKTDGWLKLDGNTWVVVDYAALPADLQASYPPQVYPAGGSSKLQAGKGAKSKEGGPSGAFETAEAFDPEKAKVAFEATPLIEQEPKKKSKKAEPVDF